MMDKVRSGELKPLQTSLKKEQESIGGYYPSDQIVIAGRTGCLAKGTLVLTYHKGLIEVENIKEGDLLMGIDSTPRKVLSLCRGSQLMYKVTQNKGISYIVNEDHILSLKRTGGYNRYNKGTIINISLKEYLTKSVKWRHCHKGYKTPIDFYHRPLEINPYIFGVWLGDGKSDNFVIYNGDIEVIKEVKEFASRNKLKIRETIQEGCLSLGISTGITGNKERTPYTTLKEMNVLNNKHIPKNYLFNTRESRLQLLAGLIDTDGHYQKKNNTYEVTLKLRELIEQVVFLCNSLGYRACYKVKTVDNVPYYRIHINGNNLEEIPVRIPRKKAIKSIQRVDKLVTGIKVEKLKVDDYYGFELDKDKLFLLEDCTVTHNTGKSAKMLHDLLDFCDPIYNPTYTYDNFMILLDSFEMADWRNILRMISREAKVEVKSLLDYQKRLTEERYEFLRNIAFKFSHLPIYISNRPLSAKDWIESKKQIQGKFPKKRIVNVFDHTRLGLKVDEKKEEELITNFMVGGVQLKNQFEMWNFFLSQMNRNIETNTSRDKLGTQLPVSSDIFGSDAAFQCADVVIALHRPGMYGVEYFNNIPTGYRLDNPDAQDNLLIECVLKQREGWTGNLILKHDLAINHIEDYELQENFFTKLPTEKKLTQLQEPDF